MKLTLSILALFIATPVFANSMSELAGIAAYKELQSFVAGVNNWGKGPGGQCRFDFDLNPDVGYNTGFNGKDRLRAYVLLDKAEGKWNAEFGQVIGHMMGATRVNNRTLVLEGGSYDGSATLTLKKLADGSVRINAKWIDNEMGPDRKGTCILPKY